MPTVEEVVAAPSATEATRRSSAVPEAAEESPNFFDERFDFEEPFDLLESGESAAVPPETSEQAGESGERRPRKRRRRRRRGREGEPRESREPVLPEISDDRPSDIAPPAPEDSEQIFAAAEAETVDIERPSDEPTVESVESGGTPFETPPSASREEAAAWRRAGPSQGREGFGRRVGPRAPGGT